MNRTKVIGILWIALFAFSSTFAQLTFQKGDAEITDWKATVSKNPKDLKVGDGFSISFKAHVHEAGWHLYSTQAPPNGLGYNPTVFEFYPKESKGVEKVGGLSESPSPYSYYDDIMSDTVRFFKEHDVTFTQKFKVTGKNVKLVGDLSYQICVDPEEGGQCRFLALPLEYTFSAAASGNNAGKDPNEGNTPPDKGTTDPSENTTDGAEFSGDCLDCFDAAFEKYRLDEEGNFVPKEEEGGGGQVSGDAIPLEDRLKATKEKNDIAGQVVVEGEELKEKKGGCGDQNLWVLFFQAFLFGFAAVLTPCVFPMIPLTVSFFTKQSGNRAKGIRNAFTYGFFIIFIYTAIGTAVSAIFGADFLYLMSINPWVNLVFFVLLFVFALSFFGMFEITLPSSWSTKLDSNSDRGGLLGIFFMALTLAVVSFSCTGPLVGTALIEAAGGCFWGPILSMLGFSSALAIPFMLFAIFPGWMNGLPRSGGWLNSVKVVLGFLELALGMKFLSQTDLFLKWHILDREVFIGVWIVIFLMLGIYLLGKIRLPHDSPIEKLSVPRMILAMASFIFVLYLIPGLWGARLPVISGLLPPPNPDIGVKIIGQKEMNAGTLNGEICSMTDRNYYDVFESKEGHGFCTFYDLEEGLEYARQWNRPVFLDFTGHTCANCRQMEQKVWPKPEVAKLLKEEFVMISLYVDEKAELETPETINGQKVRTLGRKYFQIEKMLYNTIAQPYYAVVDYELKNMATPRAYNEDLVEYINFLKTGAAKYKELHGEPVK